VGLSAREGLLAGRDPRVLVLWALVVVQFLPRMWMVGPQAWRMSPRNAVEEALVRSIAQAPEPVLSEAMGAALLAGKVVWVEPFANSQLALVGRWDQGPLLEMIRRKRFSLVVVGASWRYYEAHGTSPPPAGAEGIDPRFTTEQMRAIDAHYRLVSTMGEWHLLAPR